MRSPVTARGLADPEPMADYLDVIALGEAEESLLELLRRLAPGRGPGP
ncbi:hypothetical protein [Streptomyces anulatus]